MLKLQNGNRPGSVLVVGATAMEIEPLSGRLEGVRLVSAGPLELVVGRVGGLEVACGITGVGKVNAAMAVTAALGVVKPGTVLVVGIGGALPGAGLEIGDLAVASCEIYGDEGVETAEGFLEMDRIGLPLGVFGGERFYNRWPADPGLGVELREAAEGVARVTAGPFVTVSTVTGTDERARELAERFGGCCENMEGAGVAHVARAHGARFGEIRGISNRAGRRDRSSWRAEEAADRAREAAWNWLADQGGGR